MLSHHLLLPHWMCLMHSMTQLIITVYNMSICISYFLKGNAGSVIHVSFTWHFRVFQLIIADVQHITLMQSPCTH